MGLGREGAIGLFLQVARVGFAGAGEVARLARAFAEVE